MESQPPDGFNQMVRADEIQWTPALVPRLELLPIDRLLALDLGDALVYAHELQQDLQAVRALLHTALSVVADLTVHLDRSKQTVIRLHEALREQRAA